MSCLKTPRHLPFGQEEPGIEPPILGFVDNCIKGNDRSTCDMNRENS